MTYSNSHQIGILACPGGAVFAEKLISELEYLAQKRTRHKVDILSEKYGLPREQIITQINLSIDIRPTTLNLSHPQDRIRATHHRVPARFTRFANGEYKTEITRTVRNSDLFIIQDVENQYPVCLNEGDRDKFTLTINDHIFCLLVTVDAALQAGARAVTVVLPTYPYARQHKKKGREGLTAARIGQNLENLGVARILTLDLHSKEIENSFNRLRVENLHASYQILKALNQIVDLKDPDLVIISPDTGSVDRNKFYSTALNKALGMIYKERDYTRTSLSANQNNIIHIHLLGDVKGKTVFMADDMLGTGGTVLKAMKTLSELGAKRVICAVSLPVFSGSAIEDFEQAYRQGLFYRMIGTNAIYHDETLLDREWYVSSDISQLFARAICRLHDHRSVGSLMDNRRIIKQLLDEAMKE